ncbi:uncharacterized protein LOC111115088 [Crassostrea virginica]
MDQEFITCRICSRPLSDPCYLECLHDFCKQCIKDDLTQNLSTKLSAYACPVCKQLTETKNTTPEKWAEQLPASDFVGALTEVHKLKNEDVMCTPCKRKSKTTTGSKWCRTCHEALCSSCIDVHASLKTTMKHSMMDLHEVKLSGTKSLIFGPNCMKHDQQSLRSFCEDHNELICSLCIGEKHKQCKQIRTVDEEVKARNYELQEVSSKSANQLQIVQKALKSSLSSLTDVETTRSNLSDKIKSVRKRVDEILTKCEKKSLEELERIETDHRGKLEQDVDKLESLNEESSHTNQLLEQVKNYGSNAHILQCLQQVRERSNKNSTAFEEYREVKELPKVTFVINRQLDGLMRTLTSLGDFSIGENGIGSTESKQSKTPDNQDEQKPVNSERRFKRAENVLSVRTPSDENACVISGILSLPNLDWLFCDKGNRKLKLYNDKFRMKTEHILEQPPYDITLLGDQIVAVTIPDEMKISIFKILAGINLQEEIRTKDRCYGISYSSSESKFVVTCPFGSPASLRLLSRNGEELMVLIPEEDHQSLFLRPLYVRFDNSGNSILVSDSQRNRVTSITRSVYRRFHYTHANLRSPRGLALDSEGGFLVAGWGSDTVHRVDAGGRCKQEVLSRHDGVISPQAVALSYDQTAFVLSLDESSCRSDFVLLFSL